ncbi:hypothetical protein RZS08_10455, partial [Arthrospira platensis SPKY1]|nr:hypothetical protein [Arthrospira platensis SPKY1]
LEENKTIEIKTDNPQEKQLEKQINKIFNYRESESLNKSIEQSKKNAKEFDRLSKKESELTVKIDSLKATNNSVNIVKAQQIEPDLYQIRHELNKLRNLPRVTEDVSLNKNEQILLDKLNNAKSLDDFIINNPKATKHGMDWGMRNSFLEESLNAYNNASPTDDTISFKVANDGHFTIANDG